MDTDQVTQALSDPQGFLSHTLATAWLAIVVSVIAGFVVPWACAKLVKRKLGCLAYTVVGTIASSVFYSLTQSFQNLFSHSVIMGVLVVLFLVLVGLFLNGMRKP